MKKSLVSLLMLKERPLAVDQLPVYLGETVRAEANDFLLGITAGVQRGLEQPFLVLTCKEKKIMRL